jgi:DUF1009 family protein
VLLLPAEIRGTQQARRGVLVKAAKPGQERRVDLPVIGARTIELAAAAGLAGIVVESGAVLVMNRSDLKAAADRAGLFVIAAGPQDIAV